MSVTKQIGVIRSARFGMGGYDDDMIGLCIELGSNSNANRWSVSDFKGAWTPDGAPTEQALEQRKSEYGETVVRVAELLRDAKVKSVEALKGIPIEATFDDGNSLKEWRILTEAIL